MGRGVDYDVNATQVWYFDSACGCDADDYCDCWDYFIEYIQEILIKRFKSLSACAKNDWASNERRNILENELATLSVSEYCGCASLSLSHKDDWGGYDEHMRNCAGNWCAQVVKSVSKVLEESFPNSLLTKLGTMSNGVSVFQKVGA